MSERVIIIGAGITGAAIAFALSQRGAEVTVVEAGQIAGAASGQSFGWINASFYADAAHFHLRHGGIAAWHRVCEQVKSDAITWPGSLVWDASPDELAAEAAALQEMGYAVEMLDKHAFARREPGVATPPELALHFPQEGVVELERITRDLLLASHARILSGSAVHGIETQAGRVMGVRLSQGILTGDQVVVAAGTGAPGLTAPLGVDLPMVPRPGLLLRSTPVKPCLSHVLASPGQELRQDRRGRLIAPTAARHQGDESVTVAGLPHMLAEAAMVRIRALLPDMDAAWQEVTQAWRPVPSDGKPVLGPAGPEGLYLAVMHSGATLAALVGALVAEELMGGAPDQMLAPYRPGRFVVT
ncbi:MAG: fructosyl-amino acid oxidase [Rhodobacterales bacterium]|nr:MAG: fructosyl-amino acid oxidase [Rhodobacterales bacterium]